MDYINVNGATSLIRLNVNDDQQPTSRNVYIATLLNVLRNQYVRSSLWVKICDKNGHSAVQSFWTGQNAKALT